MTIQEAIEKAIEGGWSYIIPQFYRKVGVKYEKGYVDYPLTSIFDDPLFWQSLGKAMGWKKYTWESCGGQNEYTDEEDYTPDCEKFYYERILTFVFFWHNFIDHIAEGKDAESFFETL